MLEYLTDVNGGAVPLVPLRRDDLEDWLANQPQTTRNWVQATGFAAEAGGLGYIVGPRGKIQKVLVGLGGDEDPWVMAGLPSRLPVGAYRLEAQPEPDTARATWMAIAWALGTYSFERYKTRTSRDWPILAWPANADRAQAERCVSATELVRDLINIPAADMGPEELANAAADLAQRYNGRCRTIVGEQLLRENYPAVHAVGKASNRPPRFIDLRWGSEDAPKVTLVGKGVCFDSGGLDLKSAGTMKLMKKDMGGAAHVLGLARMVMAANLNIRLRVLVPAVENVVSGNAMRPLDVIATRKGLTVEVGNTDAEGRLILCDALTEADREQPALLLDCATLTGAARTALGTDLPALFSNDDRLAEDILRQGMAQNDPLWRLPLWKAYRRQLDSKVADLSNISESAYGGAITAALFLQEFVSSSTSWAHIDMMAWNTSSRPGRPEGGEAQTLRALYAMLVERFG